jgi:hypothetical protein
LDEKGGREIGARGFPANRERGAMMRRERSHLATQKSCGWLSSSICGSPMMERIRSINSRKS